MPSFTLYVAVISAIITYVSTVVVIKKIKNGEDELDAVAVGAISFAVLVGCIIIALSNRR